MSMATLVFRCFYNAIVTLATCATVFVYCDPQCDTNLPNNICLQTNIFSCKCYYYTDYVAVLLGANILGTNVQGSDITFVV